jgi:type II secretory pathway pseudopilin PulG
MTACPPGPPSFRRPRREHGLTLLEVVIALLLFAMIAIFLLEGHSRASDAVMRMQVEREMAELLRLRLDLATLEHDEYREGTTEGTFPGTVSHRLIDEEKVLGDRYPGYRWEVTITPTLGAGATSTVEVQDDRTYEPLFAEEGETAGTTDQGTDRKKEDAAVVQPDDIDRMLYVQVTIYPPGYDPGSMDEDALQPRSAWTAIYLPPDEADTGGAGGATK